MTSSLVGSEMCIRDSLKARASSEEEGLNFDSTTASYRSRHRQELPHYHRAVCALSLIHI
eukprot:7188699-Prorocentrum_lima.AAC.1